MNIQKTGKSFLGKAAIIAPTMSLKSLSSLQVVCLNVFAFLATAQLVCGIWMLFSLINSVKISGFSFFNKGLDPKRVSQNLVDEEPSKVLVSISSGDVSSWSIELPKIDFFMICFRNPYFQG